MKVQQKFKSSVEFASKNKESDVKEMLYSNIVLGGSQNFLWKDMSSTLVSNLVNDVIIGLKLSNKHQSITLSIGGKPHPLNLKSSIIRKFLPMRNKVGLPTLFHRLNKMEHPSK